MNRFCVLYVKNCANTTHFSFHIHFFCSYFNKIVPFFTKTFKNCCFIQFRKLQPWFFTQNTGGYQTKLLKVENVTALLSTNYSIIYIQLLNVMDFSNKIIPAQSEFYHNCHMHCNNTAGGGRCCNY